MGFSENRARFAEIFAEQEAALTAASLKMSFQDWRAAVGSPFTAATRVAVCAAYQRYLRGVVDQSGAVGQPITVRVAQSGKVAVVAGFQTLTPTGKV